MSFGRFEVEGHRTESKSWECYADSPQEAIAHFQSQNPDFRADYVTAVVPLDQEAESWGVIGSCEGCSVAILDGDDYEADGDMVRLCLKCAKLA